ncbi:F-box protein At4g02733-like isoform X2 [Aristolochia californica]|uniref:F-box protein At4g02733-like isoform X2 n=1 Tax=Aristolochia californica TaxID=171875 RepID=UPI0035E2551B
MASVFSKRLCCSSDFSRASNPEELDKLLETLLGFTDVSSGSLDSSLDRLLESRSCDWEKNQMIEKSLRLGLVLQEAARKCERKRASLHNSMTWPLPPDLSVNVFSMLDTQSLCHVAATCRMFNECAIDPLCYTNIDLTSVVPKVNNGVVSLMTKRAGKYLQSLKLGILSAPAVPVGNLGSKSYPVNIPVDASCLSWNDKRSRQGKESCVLTRSCLMCLKVDNGKVGALLRQLHLYNIERMDSSAFCAAISSCPSLLDLESVGLHVELGQVLEAVSTNCHLIERLFFESSKTGRDDTLKPLTCTDLVNGCPKLTSLALRGFKLQDSKGLRQLKSIDISTSYAVTGTFLRSLGNASIGPFLEVLSLRDCMHLREVEVTRFLSAIVSGDCKFLRYLDISNKEGLALEEDWYDRCYTPSIPISRVMEQRPEICLLAEFPLEGSSLVVDQSNDGEVNDDMNFPSQSSGPVSTSDGSSFTSTSESNYNSDIGSGTEDSLDAGYAVYDESSDEVELLLV